jgi:hypothetical protein
VLEVQDTPDSSVCATAPAGVASTVQVVPFHASTRASPGLELCQPPPANTPVPPTAMQKLGEVHEIASRAGLAPAEPEAAAAVQAIPVQRSAKGSMSVSAPPSAGWLSAAPTAMQKPTDVHDTPVRLESTRPSTPPVGLGRPRRARCRARDGGNEQHRCDDG